MAFRFGMQGKVNVFCWVEGRFGYALSSESSRDEPARVARVASPFQAAAACCAVSTSTRACSLSAAFNSAKVGVVFTE